MFALSVGEWKLTRAMQPSLPSAASGIGWYEFMLTAPRLSNEFRF